MSAALTTSVSNLAGKASARLRRLVRVIYEERNAGQLDEDIWPLLVASDPDGIWYPWPELRRRPADDGSEMSNRQL
jgi:hypothetical protein